MLQGIKLRTIFGEIPVPNEINGNTSIVGAVQMRQVQDRVLQPGDWCWRPSASSPCSRPWWQTYGKEQWLSHGQLDSVWSVLLPPSEEQVDGRSRWPLVLLCQNPLQSKPTSLDTCLVFANVWNADAKLNMLFFTCSSEAFVGWLAS